MSQYIRQQPTPQHAGWYVGYKATDRPTCIDSVKLFEGLEVQTNTRDG